MQEAIPLLREAISGCKCFVVVDADNVHKITFAEMKAYKVFGWGVHTLAVSGRDTNYKYLREECNSWATMVTAETHKANAADIAIAYILTALEDVLRDTQCAVVLVSGDTFVTMLKTLLEQRIPQRIHVVDRRIHLPAFLLRRVLTERSHILSSAMNKVQNDVPLCTENEFRRRSTLMFNAMGIPHSGRITNVLILERAHHFVLPNKRV